MDNKKELIAEITTLIQKLPIQKLNMIIAVAKGFLKNSIEAEQLTNITMITRTIIESSLVVEEKDGILYSNLGERYKYTEYIYFDDKQAFNKNFTRKVDNIKLFKI